MSVILLIIVVGVVLPWILVLYLTKPSGYEQKEGDN